ncbi:membrane anchoring protein efr3a [Physocladia obscura]|uniref:Membrane anchoring protein efr3a n=1 Tax=Physocladia obscura TaxID=109957 RepID=A0AAD5T2E5_9FUNG|nr:membrane anchoring protein efr3a [Physocladia obscura]
MFTCCGQSGINPRAALKSNHAALVDKVYPATAGEATPRGASLSTLLFYANAKPIKLRKVGAYLAKRTEADLARGKAGFVAVSLLILDALMLQCPPAYITIMAADTLHIVDLVLASPDPDLLLQATKTFVTFNSLYRHDALVDSDVISRYKKLVWKFCSQCSYATKNSTIQQKIHLSGLRAIESISSSDTFISSTPPNLFVEYMSKIIPAILSNIREERRLLATTSIKPTPTAGNIPTPPMRAGSISDDLITPPLLIASAQTSLRNLIQRSSVAPQPSSQQQQSKTLRTVLTSIWAYFDETTRSLSSWADAEFVHAVAGIVRDSVAPQALYIVVAGLIEMLKQENINDNNDDVRAVGIVGALTVVITGNDGSSASIENNNSSSASGIVAIEILQVFVNLLIEISSSSATATQKNKKLRTALIDGIGALVVHVTYPTLLTDIVAFIVNQLEKATKSCGTTANDMTTLAKTQIALLECLIRVVAVRRACLSPSATNATPGEQLKITDAATRAAISAERAEQRANRGSLMFPARINAVLLVPVVQQCLVFANYGEADDGDEWRRQDVRLVTALFLENAVELELLQNSVFGADITTIPGGSGASVADQEFLTVAYQKLYDYVTVDKKSGGNGPVDYMAIGALVAVFFKRFGSSIDGAGRSLQFFFGVQKKHAEFSAQTNAAIANLFLIHLTEIAEKFSLTELKKHLVEAGFENTSPSLPIKLLEISVQTHVFKTLQTTSGEPAVSARTFENSESMPHLSPQNLSKLSYDEIAPFLFGRDGNGGVFGIDVRDFVAKDFDSGGDESVAGVASYGSGLITTIPLQHDRSTVGSMRLVTPAIKYTPSGSIGGSGVKKEGESIKSSASYRAGTPVKFEDLKDAISLHSSSEFQYSAEGGSIRTVTPGPKTKIDVKKLLNNISLSITRAGDKNQLLEPGIMAGKHYGARFNSGLGKSGKSSNMNAGVGGIVPEIEAAKEHDSPDDEDDGTYLATAKTSFD